jgi:mycothiol synthase
MTEGQTFDLTCRVYQDESDIQALAGLMNAAASVDGAEYARTVEEVRRMMSAPLFLPEENCFLFEVAGQLVAYGRVDLEEGPGNSVFFVRGTVHPDWRRRGIGTRVMERIEQRIQERLEEASQQAVYANTWTQLKHEDRQALSRKMGYELARYFFDMERTLRKGGSPVEVPEPVYPAGIVVQSMKERPDLEAVWLAVNESFRDHWGHTDLLLEQWQHWIAEPAYRSDLWFIAWDTEHDEPAGVCLTSIEPGHNARVRRQEGWVRVLGVRRPYRKQGLGRALLLSGMKALQEEGMDWAMLGVDSENLTGALRLYEGAGFRPVKRSAAFRKVLRS